MHSLLRAGMKNAGVAAALFSTVLTPIAPLTANAESPRHKPISPIQHVIVIVGENRSFDHIFATYVPKTGESINNLLSEGIVNADGTPGSRYSRATQYSADITGSTAFQMAPTKDKKPYLALPAPLSGGPANVCDNNGMCNLGDATSSEDGLPAPPAPYYESLLQGGTGLASKVPDSRIAGVQSSAPYSTLEPGPFQLTNSTAFPYISYAASPVHRFYEMWQQEDCSAEHATAKNPSGCLADLFTWTEVTVGSNINGKAQPNPFCTDYAPGCSTTGEGATSMGFYNMQRGDAPYTKFLADRYAMSDNYHQPAMGGTGLDEIMLFFGDAIWFKDQNGNLVPPNPKDANGGMTGFGGPVNEIENPTPVAGTNNWWTNDGYGGFGNNGSSTGVYGGGSYSNCSDVSQPGVGQIVKYLASLKPPIKPNCDPGHYYLLNNYNPGYFGDGSNAYEDTNPNNTPFTIPPTSQRSIGDVLLENNVSWKSYNDQWDTYLTDKYQQDFGKVGPLSDAYCNICNGFQYQTQIMTNTAMRNSHIFDTDQLYQDIESANLPAVSFVKPSGWVDGHPASSKWDLFEGFAKKIVDMVQSKPELWKSTAIFVTVDEGGGYYDSGYVQPLDFFGDGTRIPLIVVSPWTKPGHISHSYSDHVSILKFIEHNWGLPAISGRSRDNDPNPISTSENAYVPTNSPAIDDLFDLFNFSQKK
ncbi:MAG TPA: alkaline phosphatase family protein [Terriglobales bacterium]|nr:alkaline phosphatase family protein [Terriglobales bacterium]